MFTKSESLAGIDDAIARAVAELDGYPVMSDEYDAVLDRIVRLQKMKDAETRTSSRPSADTLILAATNLMGIAMILRHEHLNVITSKATGFVKKTP